MATYPQPTRLMFPFCSKTDTQAWRRQQTDAASFPGIGLPQCRSGLAPALPRAGANFPPTLREPAILPFARAAARAWRKLVQRAQIGLCRSHEGIGVGGACGHRPAAFLDARPQGGPIPRLARQCPRSRRAPGRGASLALCGTSRWMALKVASTGPLPVDCTVSCLPLAHVEGQSRRLRAHGAGDDGSAPPP